MNALMTPPSSKAAMGLAQPKMGWSASGNAGYEQDRHRAPATAISSPSTSIRTLVTLVPSGAAAVQPVSRPDDLLASVLTSSSILPSDMR